MKRKDIEKWQLIYFMSQNSVAFQEKLSCQKLCKKTLRTFLASNEDIIASHIWAQISKTAKLTIC